MEGMTIIRGPGLDFWEPSEGFNFYYVVLIQLDNSYRNNPQEGVE